MAPQINRLGTFKALRMGASIAVVVISVRYRRIVVRVRIGRIPPIRVGIVAAIVIRIGRPAKADPIAEAAAAPMAAITPEPAAEVATAEVAAPKVSATKVSATKVSATVETAMASMPLGQRGRREKANGDEDQAKYAREPHGDLPLRGHVVNARARFP